jgi:hypothetical protein
MHNLKINNFLDKTFGKISESRSESINISEDSSKINSQNTEKTFKILQLSLKTICLLAFIPYALLGMFYINKSFIFIPCLVMALTTVLLAMFSAVKIQILQENLQNKIANIANSFKDFINQNHKNIADLKGIEILEQSIKTQDDDHFLSADFIADSLIKGSAKINNSPSNNNSLADNFNFKNIDNSTKENSELKV